MKLEEQFPECIHFIDHYGSSNGGNTRQTIVFFGGRYELRMTYEVTVDYSKGKFVPVSGPEFHLHEVSSIDIASRSISFSDQKDFGAEAFEVLCANQWDFAAIGFTINPKEVDGFDWLSSRELGRRKKIRLTK